MRISLRSLLIVPFVIQIIGITSVVGYLSYRSGERVVEDIARELMVETGSLISQNLDAYLQSAHRQNRAHIAALEAEAISFDNLTHLHRYLTLQLLEHQSATTFLLGTPEGQLRASHRVSPQDYDLNSRLTPPEVPIEIVILDPAASPDSRLYSVDAQGNPERYLQTIRHLPVQDRSWYRRAAETKQPGWSEIFQIGSTDHFAISAFAPVYDEAQQLAGVFAANVSLRQLDTFLANLTFSQTGQAFIMQADGLLVANSSDEPTDQTAPAPDASPPPLPMTFQRLSAAESDNPVIRAAAQLIQTEVGSLSTLPGPQNLQMQVQGDRHFIYITPYQDTHGLHWFIVTTVPRAALTPTLRDHLRRSIIGTEVALLITMGFGIWLSRRIIRPLRDLNRATQAYARGERPVVTKPTLIQEIEALRSAFVALMQTTDEQQRQIDQHYADHARSLKAEIAAQTAALRQTAEQLGEAQRLAKVGSWELDLATQQLTWSAEMYCIVGRDPALGVPPQGLIDDLLIPADRVALQQAVEAAIATGQPYTLEQTIRRIDGSPRYIINRGAAQCNECGEVVRLYGTTSDITERKVAELALAASEEKRRLALELTNTGSWEFDINTGQANWSDSHYRLMGLAPHAAIANYETWRDRVHPEDLPFTEADFQQAIDNHTLLSVEYRVVHPNGQVRWVLTTGQAMYAADGTPLRMVGVMMDISDRKQAEQALALSEAKFRGIYDQAAVGIGYADEQGIILGCNQQLQSMFGYRQTEIVGQPIQMLAHPDCHADQTERFRQLYGGEIESYSIERRYLRKDGSLLWGNTTVSLLRSPDGKPLHTIAIIQDVSDRHQLEAERDAAMAELRASEANYLAILQHQTELVTRFKADGTLLFVNQAFCEYYAVDSADVVGKPYHPLIYPEDQPAIEQCLARLSPQKPYATIEHRVLVQGAIRWMQWTNRAIYDDQGELVELQSVGRDIHNRKQAEADLRASQAQYQRLVDDIGEKFVVFSHTGAAGVLTYVSDGITSVFGLHREDVIGKTWMETVHWLPETSARAAATVQAMQDSHIDFQQFEMEFIHPDGDLRTILTSQHPVRNSQGKLIAIEGIVEDITDRKQAELQLQLLNTQLQKLATTDSLTAVANRRQFLMTLFHEWSRHQRERCPLALVMLDIDHFKAFNDTYGHPAGDECLIKIATTLQKCTLRPGDLVARYGGEEFIMLLSNTDQLGAIAIAQRVQQQIAELAIPHRSSPTAPQVTVSLGGIVVDMPTEIDEMAAITRADKMLYAAKRTRNTYCVEAVHHL